MKRWRIVLLVVGVMLLFPGVAFAQEEQDEDGFVFRVNGTTVIGPSEVMDGVIVIDGNAVVDGRVEDTLWVIDGTGTVNGTVEGDVLVVDGVLRLGQGAIVENVTLVDSELERAQGATITGDLHERSEFISFGWGGAVFSFLFWLGTTLVVLLAGLAFAAIGGRQLTNAGGALTSRLGQSVLTALVLWIGLPIAAVLAMLTLIGIPLGIAVVVFVLPALGFLGYLVAGTRLGTAIVRGLGRSVNEDRPYLAATVGLLVLQLIALVPVIGGLVALLAGFAGSGALVYRMARGRAERRHAAPQPRQELAPAA